MTPLPAALTTQAPAEPATHPLDALLPEICNLIDGCKLDWQAQGCWSEWDQSVRDRITAYNLARLAAPTPVEPAKRYGDLTGTFADKTNTFQPPVAQSLEAPEGSGAATQDAKGEPQERQVSNLRQSPDRQCDTGSACVLASAPGDPFVEPGNPANQAPAVVPSDEQIDAAWFKLPVARTAGGLTDLFAHRIQFARAVLALLSPPGVLVEPAAWLIEFKAQGVACRNVHLHNSVGDYRDLDPAATSTPLYAAPAVPVGGIKEPEQQGHQTESFGKFPDSAGEGSGKGGA